jgi:hypothetical protein
MKIKIVVKKLVGYNSFKTIAALKGFWNDAKQEATVPEGYTVETDGVLWSIRLNDQQDQG